MAEEFLKAGAMVRDRPVPLQHRTVRYGRSFLEGEQDLDGQAQVTLCRSSPGLMRSGASRIWSNVKSSLG